MSSKMGAVKTSATGILDKFKGKLAILFVLGLLIAILFFTFDVFMERAIVPAFVWAEAAPGLGLVISAFRGAGAEAWDWDQILFGGVTGVGGYLLAWYIGRRKPSEVSVAEEPQAPSEAEKPVSAKVDEAVAKTQAVVSEAPSEALKASQAKVAALEKALAEKVAA